MAILYHGPLPSPTGLPNTYLASLNAKPVGPCQCNYLALNIIFWGPRPLWSLCHVFLGVNRSCPMTTSVANKLPYRALVQLHGP
jgi:hypothetical protein